MENTESQHRLDISYQYPPELLELLCDVVPALFRSKQGVIDFFAGAGVPNSLIGDWRTKLRQDKEGVRKHEIARSVLCRLNDAGEPALALRREVIKRISEFDDFSSCWENDRYKAQGIVARIQKVVNVKDSFTRINLERERERQGKQALYTAAINAQKKKSDDREAIKGSRYRLFGEKDPHQRGKRLEGGRAQQPV